MSKKLLSVRFHQGLFIAGLGNIGDALPRVDMTYSKLEMSWEPDGVYLEIGSKKHNITVVVPHANVVSAVVDTSEARKAEKDGKNLTAKLS